MKADRQYRRRLSLILKHGEKERSQQGTDARSFIGLPPMKFKLADGFPMITERDVSSFWRGAIGEILGFINGAQTQTELEKFGVKWWKSWVTPEKCAKRGLQTGDLGPGSYGAAFARFPKPDGTPFNQWAAIIQQIKEEPQLRTHFITPWIPYYTLRGEGITQKVVVAPCHGWVHIKVNPLNRRLRLHMFQRSADFPVGVPSNMIQYAALTMAIAAVTGYEAYEFVHSFSDAHMYEDQVENVREMLLRPVKKLPRVRIVRTHDSLFDFRPEDFELEEYNPNPAIKNIPVAI
jgi:thymidylate synthase